MDQEKNWMLITYYCPTHGDSKIVKPIEITKQTLLNSRKERNSKKFKSFTKDNQLWEKRVKP